MRKEMRTRGYIPPVNEEEKLLQRRVADAVKTVQAKGGTRYLGFYSDRERELAEAILAQLHWSGADWNGGFEGAERSMLCVFENQQKISYPIVCLTIKTRQPHTLTHRDYLGAILGIGITRECVGDILVTEEQANVMVKERIALLLCEELREVGRMGVTVCENEQNPAPISLAKETLRTNVSSLRLDAVLSSMMHKSRSQTAALIKSGRVQVNHVPIDSLHYEARAGDIFSLRGIGKYKLLQLDGLSRKNRIWIEYILY